MTYWGPYTDEVGAKHTNRPRARVGGVENAATMAAGCFARRGGRDYKAVKWLRLKWVSDIHLTDQLYY